MSDLQIILVVFAAAIAAVVVISLLKRSSRKRGYGDSYRSAPDQWEEENESERR